MYRQSQNNLLNSNISSTCSHNMVNVGQLTAKISLSIWGPQQISMAFRSWLCYCTDVLSGGQPNFARCLAISWAGTLYIHFWGLAPNAVLPGAKFTLRPSFVFSYICSVTAWHSSSGCQPNCGVQQRAPPSSWDRPAF